MGDRSSGPASTIVGPQPSAPHAAGAASEDTKGLNAARPNDLPAALLYGGTGKRGRAAASLLCCLEKTPFVGRARPAKIAHSVFALDRPPGPQRRTGSATYRAADGPPFLLL